jgi:hypothetical protein
MSLHTKLAAEGHPAEGQIFIEEQTLNIEKSLIYREGTLTIIIIIIIITMIRS